MKNLIILFLLLAACGSPDTTSVEHPSVTYETNGDLVTVTYYDYSHPTLGSDEEALTISVNEGQTQNYKDSRDQEPCGINLPSPGICMYPRDKILALFNGVPSGTIPDLGTNLRSQVATVYASSAVTFGGSGGWTLASNSSPQTGGDEVYLVNAPCPTGCVASTETVFNLNDSRCSTAAGTRYCPQHQATGAVIRLYEPAMATDIANSGASSQAQKDAIARNQFRHELGHALGLPHKDSLSNDIMYPFAFSFSDMSFSSAEISAVKSLVP